MIVNIVICPFDSIERSDPRSRSGVGGQGSSSPGFTSGRSLFICMRVHFFFFKPSPLPSPLLKILIRLGDVTLGRVMLGQGSPEFTCMPSAVLICMPAVFSQFESNFFFFFLIIKINNKLIKCIL